jgi:two-component system response regulator BaeR
MLPPAPLARGPILVVDDEPDVVAMIAEMLRAYGYEADTAPNGAAALRAIEAGAFAMVLSDVSMPGIDGVALYRTLQACGSPLARRFAFMSAAAGRADLQELLAANRIPLLPKPFALRDLIALVERVLAEP